METSAMTNLDIISTLAVAASAVIAALAAIFVAKQVEHMKQSREIESFLKIIDSSNQPHLRAAAEWIKYDLDGSLPYESAFPDRDVWRKISDINHYFEMIGVLTDNHYISRHLIYDQMGPWIAGTWEKLCPIINSHRNAKNAPDYCENFELLAMGYKRWMTDNSPKLDKRPRANYSSIENYYKNNKT